MKNVTGILVVLALLLMVALLAMYLLHRGNRAAVPSAAGAGRMGAGAEVRAAQGGTGENAAGIPAGRESVGRAETPPRASAATNVAAAGMKTPVNGDTGALMDLYRGQSNAILRREALQKWALDGRPGAQDVAEAALRDADPTVIIQALEILERSGQRSRMAALVAALQDNLRRPDGYGPAICEAAARALGRCGDASVVSVLVKELERHDDLAYDTVMVVSLGMIGDRSALDALDRHMSRLETLKPTETIALEPWRQAMAEAIKARNMITKGDAQ